MERLRGADAARDGLSLKFGGRVRDLTVTLAEGAASVRGRVALGEGEKLPAGLFVYLVPAEKDQAENVLRFYAAPVADDGGFALGNLAPGLYWALLRAPFDAQGEAKLRTAEGREERAALRRAVEDAKANVELKPCQNVVDYRLPFTAPRANSRQATASSSACAASKNGDPKPSATEPATTASGRSSRLTTDPTARPTRAPVRSTT